jgi:hypothetical protein
MLTILQKQAAQIGGVIGRFMLMSEQMSIISWYILRVCMIFASDQTIYSGMRVLTFVMCFFSVTLLLIWISRDQHYQSRSVVSHMPREVISLLGRFKFFFHHVFLIRNKLHVTNLIFQIFIGFAVYEGCIFRK